jgi:hypothetical protein
MAKTPPKPSRDEDDLPTVKQSVVLSVNQDRKVSDAMVRMNLNRSAFFRRLLDDHVHEYLGKEPPPERFTLGEGLFLVHLGERLRANLDAVGNLLGLKPDVVIQLVVSRYLASFVEESEQHLDELDAAVKSKKGKS